MDEARAQDNAEHSPYLRRIGGDAIGNGLTNGKHPSAWLLPFDRSPSRNVQDADFAVVQQRHASRVGQKTDLPFAYDAAQNDDSTRYSIPSYVLRDVARIAAEMTSQDVRGAGVEKRPAVVRTKSSCSSAQRRKSPAAVAPLHRFASHADKVRANSPTPNAVRNRSTERARPNATRQQSREPMVNRRPTVGAAAQTASATVTTCSRPVGPPAAACTKHQLQRKVHGGKTSERQTQQSNRSQTYSIKKPLPHKAVSSTPRLQKPGPRSYVNNVPQPPYICPSYGSLCESQWPDNDDDDDDSALALKPYAPRPERFVVSKPKSTASPRTPTPKPSVRQTKDDRTAAHDVDHGRAVRGADVCDNDDDGQLQLHVEVFPPPKARSSDDTETDQQRMMTAGTVRTSPSEHSLGSRHDIHEPQHNHMTEVDYAVRHVQTSTAAGQARPTENHHYQQQQQPLITTDPMPSMSQLSVASCRPFRSRTRLQPPATVSMSTLVTETSRSVTKPVPVAPSGPVEHRRQSKIPRPTPAGIRPGVSVTASASKCSSVASLRSELNYARPMPVERIPFGKFGLECVVPLARQEVSATVVDAFSIAGVSGRRKRFLPLAESVAEGLWKTTGSTMEALSVATAQYDAGDDVCRVSIISSLVARPVANASTQTHKAVSLSPSPRRKKTESSRQETRDKAANKRKKTTADDDEDYSGMLVRLVQLMYLQTKLNASRSDNNNATVTQSKTHSQPRSHSNLMRTLHDYLQNHKQHAQSSDPNKSDGRPMQMNARSHSAEHGATVHRMGSPASQMYSKNDSRNNRANAVKAKNVYFDPKHRSPASTNPTHDQRYHNYNRFSNISSYRTRVDSNSRPYSG